MPATPGWHAHLPTLRRTLTAMTATPWLDRGAIERLFGLRARQANYLMRVLPGRRLGGAVVVDREALLAHLDTLAEPRGARASVSSPVQRKASVLEAIDALRREERPRRIQPPPPPPPAAEGTALPAGVRLTAPGQLSIRFASPEDLLGRILGLAQSASANFAAFVASLEFGPERNSGATDGPDQANPACTRAPVSAEAGADATLPANLSDRPVALEP